MKKAGGLTAVLIAFALVLTLASTPVQAAKDTLVVADDAPVMNLDYYQNATRPMVNLAHQIWDPLIQRDPHDATLHPHLATSWKTIDATTWEFTLRPGVKFHNGQPLNAESVRFTIENRILDPAQKSMARTGFTWIKKIEIVDDLTFRVITEQPYPLVLEQLISLFPYDPVSTKEKGDQGIQVSPVGTGPYRVVSFEKGAKIVLTANENYWQPGLPKIKNLTVRFIPEVSTRMAELVSGGVDVALRIPPDQIPVVEKNPKLKIIEKPVLRVYYWQMDAAGRASQTPLTDVRVRRALWHAIDRGTILKTVLGGHADLLNLPLNPLAFGADPSIKGWEYDPAKAKALLKEAGYEQGFTLDCWVVNDLMQQVSQAATGYLDKVGIKLNFKDYRDNPGQLMKILYAGKLTGILTMGFGAYNIFDADAIMPWHFLPSASQAVYTKDPELESWLLEARHSVDPALRQALYQKAQRRVIDQAYWLPWFVMHDIQGLNKKLDYTSGVDERIRFQSARWLD